MAAALIRVPVSFSVGRCPGRSPRTIRLQGCWAAAKRRYLNLLCFSTLGSRYGKHWYVFVLLLLLMASYSDIIDDRKQPRGCVTRRAAHRNDERMTRDRRHTWREKCDEANKAVIVVVYQRAIRLARVSFIANRWPQGRSTMSAVNGIHSVTKGSDPCSKCRAESLREILSFACTILHLDTIYFQVMCD